MSGPVQKRDDWYKRDPRGVREGLADSGLDFECRGAFGMVLDLVHERGGEVRGGDGFIAGQLMIGVRKWKRIREALCGAGLVVVDGDGVLRCPMADET